MAEPVAPDDRFLTLSVSERELAVVHADGRIEIDWPLVEEIAAAPPPRDGLTATGWATARLLLHAAHHGPRPARLLPCP